MTDNDPIPRGAAQQRPGSPALRTAALVLGTIGVTAALSAAADQWRWPILSSWGLVHGQSLWVLPLIAAFVWVVTGSRVGAFALCAVFLGLAFWTATIAGRHTIAAMALLPAAACGLSGTFARQVHTPGRRG
jgi:hypothetical protein